VFVAASTGCFADLPLSAALERLVDLEFTAVEIQVHENGGHLKPSQVLEDPERAIQQCRQTHRLTPVAYNLDIRAPEPDYYRHFAACCKLAKATKVVAVAVPAAEIGTPFNAEIERLRQLVAIASMDGVLVALRTQVDTMTQEPDTAAVLCDNVKGLGLTLDPSHYVYGPHGGAHFDKVMKYTYHVLLRDTSKEQLQVRVGQGEIEYGRLINQLNRVGYDRALCADITPMPGVDHHAELRKMRLLLESLI